jgi:predicted nicotinamide N-methyase
MSCHTGAVGIVCAWLGAQKVLLTDGSPVVLETTQRNLKTNRASRASLQRLRWGYDEDLLKAEPGSWDLIVAAEVAYQRETLPAFLQTVSALLKDDGLALVVMTPELADNGRGLDGVEKLMRSAPDLDLVDVALGDDDDDEALGTARYTLRRRRNG